MEIINHFSWRIQKVSFLETFKSKTRYKRRNIIAEKLNNLFISEYTQEELSETFQMVILYDGENVEVSVSNQIIDG